MSHSLVALAFQEPATDNSFWIIVGVVLFLLFVGVVVIVIGLIVFFVMRKRKKERAAAAPAVSISSMPSASAYAEIPQSEAPPLTPASETPLAFEPAPAPEPSAESVPEAPLEAEPEPAPVDFDPSRTVAITRENTVVISYGSINFVSGPLAGQKFDVNPEGSFIGREGSLSQIVVPDPRISKRHLWLGVVDGQVKILDQESRNGTFVNDPKSERITEATLHSGDTVILGESDVARFEYEM